MKEIFIEKNKFLCEEYKGARFVFSTAENNLNFNKNLPEGLNNLNKIKKWFNLDNVGYCNQVHGDEIYIYDKSNLNGDGLVSDKKNLALGVFTADCVPVLLYDSNKKIIAAVHSGWRSTVKDVSSKAIDIMEERFNSDPKDIRAYIGPHNRQCCYEVGEEVLHEFKENIMFEDIDYSCNRKLSLKNCIEKQLLSKGVLLDNIIDLNICTFCDENQKLFSYRKSNDNYGRMFSFVYIKEDK